MIARRIAPLAAAFAAALLAPAASGAVVNVASSLDVTAPGGDSTIFVYRDTPEFAPTTPVAIAEGDTLTWTIDFKGDQQLTVLGLSVVTMFLIIDFSDPGSVVGSEQRSTGKVEFLGSSGETLFASALTTTSLGNAHVGQEFYGAPSLSGAPQRLSFFGVRYTGIVEDYLLPGLTSRMYDDPDFSLQGKLLLVGPDTGVPIPGDDGVPEPDTWALMIAGLAGVGAALRRLSPRRPVGEQ